MTNCTKVIFYIDSLEESRTLFNLEWNLKHIVKEQLTTFLQYKDVNWKKRYTMNKNKFRDEFTKFGDESITSYRKNSIS